MYDLQGEGRQFKLERKPTRFRDLRAKIHSKFTIRFRVNEKHEKPRRPMSCRKYILTYIGRDDDDLDLNNK